MNDHRKATTIGGLSLWVLTVGLWPTDFGTLAYVTGILGTLMLLDAYFSKD